ncbi:hypothetical protein N9772_04240 [Bacteroidia bacterium]|jgi:hypothetical protein|nr:hypothetical protein [Bacteroidia bacterium]
MTKNIYLIALLIAACTAEQATYIHSLVPGGGISTAEITYLHEATGVGISGGLDLIESATPIVETTLEAKDIKVDHVPKGNYSVILKNESGTSTFTGIPEKFINMDADILFSRKVFEPFFPTEWEPMKGSDFTTLYIKSKRDNQIFYMKIVATATNNEMAKYSEDY